MAGRPDKIIDWDQVDDWLAAGCTGVEVAACLGMHPDTLYNRTVKERKVPNFSAYQQEKAAIGEKALRKKQQEVALKGNPSMLIWLGKNRLKQRDDDLSKEMDQMKADLKDLALSVANAREQHVAQLEDHTD